MAVCECMFLLMMSPIAALQARSLLEYRKRFNDLDFLHHHIIIHALCSHKRQHTRLYQASLVAAARLQPHDGGVNRIVAVI